MFEQLSVDGLIDSFNWRIFQDWGGQNCLELESALLGQVINVYQR